MPNPGSIKTSCAEYETQSPCRHAYVPLPDGRTVSLFVNVETNLVVLDIVNADELSGREVYRRIV